MGTTEEKVYADCRADLYYLLQLLLVAWPLLLPFGHKSWYCGYQDHKKWQMPEENKKDAVKYRSPV